MVSASGTATAKRPAALRTEKPSARLAPEPPQSSGTHDSGRPDSVSACQSGAFHAPFLSRLMVWASARSAKIFSAVSATMFSLSATAFLMLTGRLLAQILPGYSAGPKSKGPKSKVPKRKVLGCGLFLRFMMRKSHSHDKRCPQGYLRLRHEDRQAKNEFRVADFADLQGLYRAIWYTRGRPVRTKFQNNKRKCRCPRMVCARL